MRVSTLSALLFSVFLAVGAYALIALPVVAMAQEIAAKAPASINVGDLIAPWLQTVLAIIGALLTMLIAWIAALIKTRTGFEIESRHRDALQMALSNAAGLILAKFKEQLDSKDIEVRSAAIRDGIVYVNSSAAEAVRYFALDNNDLAEKVTAKIGLVTAGEPLIVVNNSTASS